jgi:hypothetical protein
LQALRGLVRAHSLMKRLLVLLMSMLAGWPGLRAQTAAPTLPAPQSAVAFFYAANPPWAELQAFDLVVVDPGHVPNPTLPVLPRTRLAAYVALGEVQPSRDYAAKIPKGWLRGENKDWGSRLINQAQPEWPQFFADEVIAPLWASGYRTFFLDTLDSYHLFSTTPEARAVQEAGMVAVITTLKQRFPQAKLIFNRGFEILPQVHGHVEAVVAESLFQGFDAGKSSYRVVPEEDRRWLMGQLQRVKDEYRLPVIVIDYVESSKRALARETAKRILDLGFVPWVTTPDLGTLGVGAIEVMPRKVLVVHSVAKSEVDLRYMEPVRHGTMPLHYLGYVPVLVDVMNLPQHTLAGRYAGVVLWLTETDPPESRALLTTWLTRQINDQVPVAMLDPPEYMMEGSLGKLLGLSLTYPPKTAAPVETTLKSPLMGFEREPQPRSSEFYALTLAQGEPLLTLKRDQHQQVAAAITPWGGYAIAPYTVVTLAAGVGERWVLDPFGFFSQALKLPAMPVPDVSTESGRRLFMVHMDGDGWVSRSELPGNPLAAELVRDRVVNKYPVPMTISVIEAELSPKGLYPGFSALAEQVAKDIFKAPHVAMASHSYSHPFYWGKVSAGTDDDTKAYNLRLPGYKVDLQREIEGSIQYIESRLAPPGKKVEMFFWTGDCIPGSDALEWTRKVGVLNMNGGDTTATRAHPTMTRVEGMGLQRAGGYQVFAPNQNENVYTKDWTGPFYGFDRVIETFEFTEKPRRLKPINIYFHTYLTTKSAGMRSLDKIFTYALAQKTMPVYVAEYARKVMDFQHLAVARTPVGWRLRGATDLRTLRLPSTLGFADLQKSRGVAGYKTGENDSYIHLVSDDADLIVSAAESPAPRLESANGRIESFEQNGTGAQWRLKGHVPLQFAVAHADACRVRLAGRDLTPVQRVANVSYFELKTHAAGPIEAYCRP